MRLHRSLYRPAALFAAALLLGGAALHFAYVRHDASVTALFAAQTQHSTAQRDLANAPARLARLRDQTAAYTRLQASGFLAQENRLDWISSLARLRDELRLQRLVWRLHPQRPSELAPGLYASRMEINLAPVDAARLDHFHKRLRLTAQGRYSIVGCTLEAAAENALCTLDWWTWHGQ